MCIFGGGNSGAKALAAQQQQQADQARADTTRKNAALETGMGNIKSAFGGFDDTYFQNLAKNYEDYAKPQLDDQYAEQKKNLTYALARHGNLNSSVAGDQTALLDKQYSTGLTGVEGAGADYANQARRDVQAARNDVTGQLNSSYDADAATSAATAAARSLAVPVSFSPLGNLFTNVSALAAQNAIASDASPANGNNPSSGARLFSSRYRSSYGV
jgi:hypothetical protein